MDAVYIDFSKAFDKIYHKVLFKDFSKLVFTSLFFAASKVIQPALQYPLLYRVTLSEFVFFFIFLYKFFDD